VQLQVPECRTRWDRRLIRSQFGEGVKNVDLKGCEANCRLTGWWGHEEATRFHMTNGIFEYSLVDIEFVPILGARGFQLSNPSVLDMMALRASLETFNKTNMAALRERSIALTGYLEYILQPLADQGHFKIITPRNPDERGAQLSLHFDIGIMEDAYNKLTRRGVICDDRKPNVIRVSPAPLYNTFEEIWEFVIVLREILTELKNGKQ
jgi:kynureninase